MQLELFETSMQTDNIDIKVRPRNTIEEAIFRQKHEAAWRTEQARKQAAMEEEQRRFDVVLKIGQIAQTFQSRILSAIDKGEFSCSIVLPEEVWDASVTSCENQYFFTENLQFDSSLDTESEFFYQTQILASSGVRYELELRNRLMEYGTDYITRFLTFHW